MLPSILSQLGPESVDNLRWLASTLSKTGDDGKVPSSSTAAPIAEEDEEVPGELMDLSSYMLHVAVVFSLPLFLVKTK